MSTPKPKNEEDQDDFIIEYEYVPTPDAEERLTQAWEIIVELILDDYYTELNKAADLAELNLTSLQ